MLLFFEFISHLLPVLSGTRSTLLCYTMTFLLVL
jgi:hypothetical protein